MGFMLNNVENDYLEGARGPFPRDLLMGCNNNEFLLCARPWTKYLTYLNSVLALLFSSQS